MQDTLLFLIAWFGLAGLIGILAQGSFLPFIGFMVVLTILCGIAGELE